MIEQIEKKTVNLDNVIAKDITNKPNDISTKHWLIQDKIYTVVKLKRNPLNGDQFFVLDEVQPDNPLYGGYNVKRFSTLAGDRILGISELIQKLVEEDKCELI